MLWWTLRKLRSNDLNTVRHAARTIVDSSDIKAGSTLCDALKTHPSKAIGIEVLREVADLGGRKATSGSVATALRAVHELARTDDPSSRQALLSIMTANIYKDVKLEAATALATLGKEEALPTLTDAFSKWPSDPISENVLEPGRLVDLLESLSWKPLTSFEYARVALARKQFAELPNYGCATVELVGAALKHVWSEERVAIVKALSEVTDPEALAPLLAIARDWSADGKIVKAAIASLGRLNNPPPSLYLQAVKSLLTSREMQQYGSAELGLMITNLQRIQVPGKLDVLTTAIEAEEPSLRRAGIMTLGGSKEIDATDLLKRLLAKPGFDEVSKCIVVEALAQRGAPAVETLASLLNGRSVPIRQAAQRGLIDIPDETAMVVLALHVNKGKVLDDISTLDVSRRSSLTEGAKRALQHADVNVRVGAARILAKLGDQSATQLLLRMLEHDPSADGRKAAALELGVIADLKAIDSLVLCWLNDADAAVRGSVEATLGGLDPSWTKTEAARRTTTALKERLKDAVPRTRSEAARCLSKIQDPLALDPLLVALNEQDDEASLSVCKAVALIATNRVADLRLKTKDANAVVRANAVRAIGMMGEQGASALPDIVALAAGDPSHVVRTNALMAIGNIGRVDANGIASLRAALKHPEAAVRIAAVAALAKIGEAAQPVVPELALLLRDANREVAAAALRAIDLLAPLAVCAAPIVAQVWRTLPLADVLSLFQKMPNPSFIDPVMQMLFEGRASTGVNLSKLLLLMVSGSAVNEQLANWAIVAKGYEHKFRGWNHDPGVITLEGSDAAVRSLCAVNSPVTSNILHLVAQKKDVSVTMNTGCSEPWQEAVSFEGQREAARAELAKRGNPSYDPGAYLMRGDAESLQRQTQAALEDQRKRRYQELLLLLQKPRSDMGENKWTYYRELAEGHPTVEVLRLLANDLARHQYISPSDLSSFVGLMIKVGQHMSDSVMWSALAPVSGPWPQAYKDVSEGIRRARQNGPGR
jgi:HEAT repeat protein